MIDFDEILTGYRFNVIVLDDFNEKVDMQEGLKMFGQTPIASFQSISKITAKRVTERVNILGSNDRQMLLAKGVEFDDVTFKKGVFSSPHNNVGGEILESMVNSGTGNYVIRKFNLLIVALNQSGVPLFSIVLVNCFPKAVEFGDFNAEKGEILMESVTYTVEYIKQISISSAKDIGLKKLNQL
ncbi:phage tail protein [Flammeovirga kamogawensis]|uniref:Phage tail protein n=1 Tax=Flammeovirga kamogawensis TaxID=373891 RepID=A0ABX8GZR8_9BACT|nr:phage tail protein [Flammeovirga kamogawensis]MBB6458854.1 phage tail-like protein [Flammeovirga kamogawensis]QWG08435.1 phage tail protein [Flammeovirga kamogawensis]TRX66732.1 phage tail protein [Flammeovirga kamogawensis]